MGKKTIIILGHEKSGARNQDGLPFFCGSLDHLIICYTSHNAVLIQKGAKGPDCSSFANPTPWLG